MFVFKNTAIFKEYWSEYPGVLLQMWCGSKGYSVEIIELIQLGGVVMQ